MILESFCTLLIVASSENVESQKAVAKAYFYEKELEKPLKTIKNEVFLENMSEFQQKTASVALFLAKTLTEEQLTLRWEF